jgi:hypothetical protein
MVQDLRYSFGRALRACVSHPGFRCDICGASVKGGGPAMTIDCLAAALSLCVQPACGDSFRIG